MKSLVFPIRFRAAAVGVLILLAYSMLIYGFTGNIAMGVVTDLASGLAVIGIAVLMFPLFHVGGNRFMNAAYLTCRIVEGLLMIAGGIFILSPATEAYRTQIYDKIHIYFFIAGALLFYVLLYRTCLVPRFLSVWGAVATLVLLLITIIRLIGFDHALFGVLLVPIIVNEIVLAVWLMVKGFNKS